MTTRIASVVLLVLIAACSETAGHDSTIAAVSVPDPVTTTPGATTSTTPTTEPSTTTTVWTGPPLYEYIGLAVQAPGTGAVLCFGPMELSRPPACSGVVVVGLDWDEVDWADSWSGTTWARVRLVGTFDGTAFTVVRIPQPGEFPEAESVVLEISCPTPPGGWVVTDSATATDERKWDVKNYAEVQRDFAGTWLAYLTPLDESGLQEFTPADYVIVVGFTGRVEEHRQHLQALYGGPLCVAKRDRTVAELDRLQDQLRALLDGPEARDHGIWLPPGGHADVTKNIDASPPLDALVFAITSPDAYAWVDKQFGNATVRLRSALTPVAPGG
jgi:hypothetical protein